MVLKDCKDESERLDQPAFNSHRGLEVLAICVAQRENPVDTHLHDAAITAVQRVELLPWSVI